MPQEINYKNWKKNKAGLPPINQSAPPPTTAPPKSAGTWADGTPINVAPMIKPNIPDIKKQPDWTQATPLPNTTLPDVKIQPMQPVNVTAPITPTTPVQETPRTTIPPVTGVPMQDVPLTKPTLPPLFETVVPDQQTPTGYDTTKTGREALGKYTEYAMGDEDPQVTAERQRMERNKAVSLQSAERNAHEQAVRAGFTPGSPQYEQMRRSAVTDARNANIQAENAFGDFSRGRRSDQQRELETLAGGEFTRVGSQQNRDAAQFANLVKFLPSDKAQQMFAVANAKGLDLTASMSGMYDISGNLKPEYSDKTKPELIKQGIEQSVGQMALNPDTGKPWTDQEKANYTDKFYRDNFQNILYPSQVQSEQVVEQKQAKGRVDLAVESGDYSQMTNSDWSKISESQIMKAKESGNIVEFDTTSNSGDNWSDLDNMKTSDAKSTWLSKNPISKAENKGKIVEKDGILYEIIDPMRVVNEGGDNRRIAVVAKPVKGGPEEQIHRSSRFEGTTGSTAGSIIDTLNPF